MRCAGFVARNRKEYIQDIDRKTCMEETYRKTQT
jgi:hypothetical protein